MQPSSILIQAVNGQDSIYVEEEYKQGKLHYVIITKCVCVEYIVKCSCRSPLSLALSLCLQDDLCGAGLADL